MHGTRSVVAWLRPSAWITTSGHPARGAVGRVASPGALAQGHGRDLGMAVVACGAENPLGGPQRLGFAPMMRLVHDDAACRHREAASSCTSRVIGVKGGSRGLASTPGSTLPARTTRTDLTRHTNRSRGPHEPISRATGTDLTRHTNRSRAPHAPISRGRAEWTGRSERAQWRCEQHVVLRRPDVRAHLPAHGRLGP